MYFYKLSKAFWTAQEQIRWYPCEVDEDKLSIETLSLDVIRLILDKLPYIDYYRVYALLSNELKKNIELLPRRLCLYCDLKDGVTCEILCEEEGFGTFQVGLYPIVWRGYLYKRYGEWSYSKGLVACITKHTVKNRELEIMVKNIVTWSTTNIEMPHLKNAVKVDENCLGSVRIVLDYDPISEIYKIFIIETENRYRRFCIYSSGTREWIYKDIIKMSSRYITWYKVRFGFLYFSSHQRYTYQLYVLNTTSMASFPVSDHIYNMFYLRDRFYIEIVRPVLFYDDNIVAFGSESEHGELCLFKWEDSTRRWLRLSRVPREEVTEFVSKSERQCHGFSIVACIKPVHFDNRVRATTFYWKGKAGLILQRNIDYGLMYDMELNCWECIFHPGLGHKTSLYTRRE